MPATTTLKNSTQEFRDKATIILRLRKINGYLKRIFNVNKAISDAQDFIKGCQKRQKDVDKMTARAEYKMNNLDSADPDFDEKTTKAKVFIETEAKRQKELTTEITEEIVEKEKYIANREERLAELDKFISEVESGDIKVNIDEVNTLSDSLIMSS